MFISNLDFTIYTIKPNQLKSKSYRVMGKEIFVSTTKFKFYLPVFTLSWGFWVGQYRHSLIKGTHSRLELKYFLFRIEDLS